MSAYSGAVDDRRRNIIAITTAGAKQLRKLDRVVAGIQEKLLAPLSAAERTQLIRLLARLPDQAGNGAAFAIRSDTPPG